MGELPTTGSYSPPVDRSGATTGVVGTIEAATGNDGSASDPVCSEPGGAESASALFSGSGTPDGAAGAATFSSASSSNGAGDDGSVIPVDTPAASDSARRGGLTSRTRWEVAREETLPMSTLRSPLPRNWFERSWDGESADSERAALLVCEPSPVVELEPDCPPPPSVSANAAPAPTNTATPTPKAAASPPTRPTYLDAPTIPPHTMTAIGNSVTPITSGTNCDVR